MTNAGDEDVTVRQETLNSGPHPHHQHTHSHTHTKEKKNRKVLKAYYWDRRRASVVRAEEV